MVEAFAHNFIGKCHDGSYEFQFYIIPSLSIDKYYGILGIQLAWLFFIVGFRFLPITFKG